MLRKILITFFTGIFFSAITSSCSEDIPECPNKLCVIAGGWKLVEVRLDGELYNEDLANYKLVLYDPTPSTEVSSSFERVSVGGSEDNGTWSIENVNPDSSTPFKGSILRLKPQDNDLLREDWSIESFTPRQLVLVMNRNIGAKDGPAVIRFVLEPF